MCVYSVGSEREAYRVTAQMVLVCCWRSMKEVSMLLGELCQSMPLYTHTCKGLITEEQVSKQCTHKHTYLVIIYNYIRIVPYFKQRLFLRTLSLGAWWTSWQRQLV